MDSKTQIETELSTLTSDLETSAKKVMTSMFQFHELWKDIFYKDYERNDFRNFESQDGLHISIHANWKERNNTNLKIQKILKRIMSELNIAKIMNVFDKFFIEEIGQEIQEFSKTAKDIDIDKYSIQHFIEKCKEDIQEYEKRKLEEDALKRQKEASRKNCQAKGSRSFDMNFNDNDDYSTRSSNGQEKLTTMVRNGIASFFGFEKSSKYDITGLIRKLSSLSDLVLILNFNLKTFDQSINEVIEKLRDDFIATDFSKPENTKLQVENLVSVIKSVQCLFDDIQQATSFYESQALLLVLKSNPRSLINQ